MENVDTDCKWRTPSKPFFSVLVIFLPLRTALICFHFPCSYTVRFLTTFPSFHMKFLSAFAITGKFHPLVDYSLLFNFGLRVLFQSLLLKSSFLWRLNMGFNIEMRSASIQHVIRVRVGIVISNKSWLAKKKKKRYGILNVDLNCLE